MIAALHVVLSLTSVEREMSEIMLSPGKAVKVSIYLSEGSTHHGVSTYSSILDFLFFRGVSGATVLKGVAGFGADHRMDSANFVEISDHLPVKIEFIETREKVDELLGKLEEMAGSGMIEVQETTIAKPARVSKPKKTPPPEHVKIEGKTSHCTRPCFARCAPTTLPARLSTAAFLATAPIAGSTN